MTRFIPFFLFFQSALGNLTAQSSPFPLGAEATGIVDRMQILTGAGDVLQTEIRPYLRKDAVRMAVAFDTVEHQFLLKKELQDLQYLYDENNEYLAQLELPNTLFGKNQKLTVANQQVVTPPFASRFSRMMKFQERPLFKYFYQTPANFIEVHNKYFRLRASPILHFEAGRTDGDRAKGIFLNRRGLEVRGDIDDRLFFTTNFVETQAGLPNFVDDRFARELALPGINRVKFYKSRVFGKVTGYDFGQSEARIGFHATPHIGFEFGRGTHFIGNGYRSLLLSDFAAPYLFLKINTKVWRLHYQNLFAELIPEVATTDLLQPRKYFATHYLSLNLTKNWSVGLFESVVLHRSNQFELNYLNPIIFYRSVEHAIGSPDNALLGLNSRLNLGRRAQVYGQVLVDEFLFRSAILPKPAEKGWWGNKYGGQIGAKYLNALGIDHLDLQAELNIVRPFTYSHSDSVQSNYAHYGMPLAHPLVANFREVLLRAQWSPAGRFSVESKVFFIKNADDPAGKNFGNNVQLTNNSHASDFGNSIGQGIAARTLLWNFDLRYRLFHNASFDLRSGYRRKTSDDPGLSGNEYWFSAGFRMNVGAWRSEY